MRIFKSFLNDQSGATAVEYGLIATLISVTIVGALKQTGSNLYSAFTTVSANIHGN